ncbi:DMT family transporter [bacterium]|nr:DMT family transporter [bacterium]
MWLSLALLSYFISAGVYTADKFLLSKRFHSSITYAFFVGIWSIFNFFILIFDPWVPSLHELGLDLFAGFLFLITLVFWYKALHQSEATRVVPIVGALIPIFTFFLSFIFLNQTLGERQVLAFVNLIVGGILISVKETRFYIFREVKERIKNVFGHVLGSIHAHYRPTRRLIINSTIAAFLFASYYVLIKYIYTTQPFIGGFVWSRLGNFIGVLLILFVPKWRKRIKESQKNTQPVKNLPFFLFVRLSAAIAFILLNWAISLGNVALINSLKGTEYIFLLLIILFLSAKFPGVLKEQLRGKILIQKLLGTCLIVLGLYMLMTI